MKTWVAFATLLVLSSVVAQADELGATLPWVTYEAEQATTNGTRLGPDFTGQTPAREASGRSCVRLGATGQFVEFTAKGEAQGLVVRYSIQDLAGGNRADATLSLSINGQSRKKLAMTSAYSHLYGAYPFNHHPASGSPRHFWDEVRVMPGEIHTGDLVRLEKKADDSASEYLIDLIDLEVVPPPLERPAQSVSVMDFGATLNDSTDDRPAFLAAIAAARDQHKSVWFPAGEFVIKGTMEVSGVTLSGAGMWYSTLVGTENYPPGNRVAIDGAGSDVTLSDFAIVGKLNYRNDTEANDGLGGSFGERSVIRNIWVEHTKTGVWLVNANGLEVEGCRFRDTMADGINLCVGMRNTTVRNCTARGTGDDCFAMWPATYVKSIYRAGGNRFVHCTAQLPYLAQGFAIYGGDGNGVEACEAIDIPYGAGLLASTTFPTDFGFAGVTPFEQVSITRAGGRDGAIGVVANLIDLGGLRFGDVEVVDSVTDGIRFTTMRGHSVSDTNFDKIRIGRCGLGGGGNGIVVSPGAMGSAMIGDVKMPGLQNNSARFEIRSASLRDSR